MVTTNNVDREKMRLFVTGGLGEIGRGIAPALEGHDVTMFDIEDGHRSDTRKIEMIRDAMPGPRIVDMVIHLANIPHPYVFKDAEPYRETNVGGTENLLAVCGEKGVGGILFVSSLAAVGFDVGIIQAGGGMLEAAAKITGDEEYPKGKPPWDEAHAVPLSPDDWGLEKYGTSKVVQEQMITDSGLPYLILRCGPYGYPCEGLPPYYGEALSASYLLPAIEKALTLKKLPSEIIHVCGVGVWGGERLQEFLVL